MNHKLIPCISFSPVTGLAASFGSVPTESGLKTMSAANFFKEAKAAAFRLRSPPAEEANVANCLMAQLVNEKNVLSS